MNVLPIPSPGVSRCAGFALNSVSSRCFSFFQQLAQQAAAVNYGPNGQSAKRAEVNIDSASGQPYVIYEGTTLDMASSRDHNKIPCAWQACVVVWEFSVFA